MTRAPTEVCRRLLAMSETVWYHHAMPSLSLPSANLHYRIDGSGPTLLLLHGAGGNSLVWFQQIPELSKHFSCIAIDQPGFGRSAWRHEPVLYSTVLCELIEYFELERIGVLGHSLGGWAALQLALRLPESISALILSSSWAGSRRHWGM
jgi:3-oxoadipate enol-lactonase